MADSHTVSVLLDDGLLSMNRAMGALRRRRLPVERFALTPAGSGEARLTFVIPADAAAAERVARQFAKLVGVKSVAVFPGDQPASQELALIRLREPGGLRAELFRVVARFPATVVSESGEGVVVRVAGPGAVVQSLIASLESFEILDVARSGPITLGATSFTPEEVAS